MENKGAKDGIFCIQNRNKVYWNISAKKRHEKYGLIGYGPQESDKIIERKDIRIRGFKGKINIVGGKLANACYKVSLNRF